MSGTPYVPGHIIDEARDRRRQGHSLASLACRLGISPEALGMLLNESTAKPVQAAAEFDLWAVERLQAQL